MFKPGKTILSIVFLASAVLVVVFGVRTYHYYERLERIEVSGFQVESLRGWMTMPYIAQVYHVNEDDLYDTLAIPKASNSNLGLRQIIDKYSLDEVEARKAIERQILQASTANPDEDTRNE